MMVLIRATSGELGLMPAASSRASSSADTSSTSNIFIVFPSAVDPAYGGLVEKESRHQRPAQRATFALAKTVRPVGTAQTATLCITLQTGGQPPGRMRAALAPANPFVPDCGCPFAARKR